MSKTEANVKRRRSWFSKRDNTDGIEIISCSVKPTDASGENDLERPLDHSSPLKVSDKGGDKIGDWMDERVLCRDVFGYGEKGRAEDGDDHAKLKTRPSLLRLLKATKPEEADGSSPSLQSDEGEPSCRTSHRKKEGRPKSQGSLGSSVTPFRIRDNLSCLLNLNGKDTEEEDKELRREVLDVGKHLGDPVKYSNTYAAGVPCTRLVLLKPAQCSAFLLQLKNIKKATEDYSFYYDWILWIEEEPLGDNVTSKELRVERAIESKLDLKIAMRYLKRTLQYPNAKVHIAKAGIVPKRLSSNLIESGTLKFQIPLGYEHEMLKEVLGIVLDDTLYKPQDIQCKYKPSMHLDRAY